VAVKRTGYGGGEVDMAYMQRRCRSGKTGDVWRHCDGVNTVAASTCRWRRSGDAEEVRRGSDDSNGEAALRWGTASRWRRQRPVGFGVDPKQKETRGLVGLQGYRWDRRKGAEAACAGQKDARGRAGRPRERRGGRRRGIRRWGGRRRPRAALVERVPTAGGEQGRAGGGQRWEVFLEVCGRRSCAGGGGGDGEADPREGKKVGRKCSLSFILFRC
jgi:hypothetical protein